MGVLRAHEIKRRGHLVDHKTYLASRPADFRNNMTSKKDRPGLLRLGVQFGLIGFLGAWITVGWPFWQVLLVPQGALLISLFTVEHECTHQTPFASRWLNEAVGHLAGFAILLPFLWFRYFHLAHHRWTNLPEKDPELAEALPRTPLGWVVYLCGLRTWWGSLRVFARLVANREQPSFLPKSATVGAVREARLMLIAYLLLIWLFPELLWAWILPVMLGQPLLRLYLLAEHGDCPQVVNMFQNTRTTFTTGLVRFFTWNMPFHTEHHVWPAVPFYRLPRLHDDMKTHLQVTADGYMAFNRDYLARHLQAPPDQAR